MQEKVYNLLDLKDMSGGDIEFENEMIAYFIGNSPKVIEGLKDTYKNKKWDELRHIAHKFVSNVKMMGIKSIVGEIDEVEDFALNQNPDMDIWSMILKIEHTILLACEQLKTELK